MADGLWIPAAGVLAAIVVAFALFFWWKGQPFAEGAVFRASRFSRGNRFFPTQVLVTPTSVVHYTPEVFGRKEHSIHIVHVASVSIDTNLFFSDVLIETSGGTTPVTCHGHRKADAVRMKQLIEEYQTAIYRTAGNKRSPAGAGGEGGQLEVARG
ncbi:MAG TPA: hypothetical protein VL919_03845 [Vicinamibacterales bacterium]|nr:hypothetical protein [Vicinamibacterales bacterium]